MNTQPQKHKRIMGYILGAALLAHPAAIMVGCTGGDDGPDGASTIQGTISSFSSSGAFYMPRQEEGLLHALVSRVINFVIPEAQAAVAGVVVSVQGTDLSGTTADDGFFIISGVPGGQQTLLFTYEGRTESLAVNVPDSGVITISEVEVENGRVDVARVDVVEYSNDNDGDDDNGNDNGDDDNSNDNDDDDNRNGNSNDNDDDGDNDNDDDDNDND